MGGGLGGRRRQTEGAECCSKSGRALVQNRARSNSASDQLDGGKGAEPFPLLQCRCCHPTGRGPMSVGK